MATSAPTDPATGRAGHYSGGDETLTVSFDTDGSTVTGFTAHGGWYCYPQGEQVMSFAIDQGFPIAADGTFGATVSGSVSTIKMTWIVSGTITDGGQASGTLEVSSDNDCMLSSTNWSVSR